MRNPDRLEILHRANHLAIAESLIAIDQDMAHFDLRAFIDCERNVYATRRNLTDLRRHSRVLMAALCLILLQHVLRALYFPGIVLRFGSKTHLALFEAVENFGFTNR